ncbi:hypothetical protein ACFQ07_29885, partial [Actinomadura adrarensis]
RTGHGAPARGGGEATGSATQRLIVVAVLINAVTLGLETVPSVLERHGSMLHMIDRIARYMLVTELRAKVYVHRAAFVRDPWHLFESVIVAISPVPHYGGQSVLPAPVPVLVVMAVPTVEAGIVQTVGVGGPRSVAGAGRSRSPGRRAGPGRLCAGAARTPPVTLRPGRCGRRGRVSPVRRGRGGG